MKREDVDWSAAGKKAWVTRRANEQRKSVTEVENAIADENQPELSRSLICEAKGKKETVDKKERFSPKTYFKDGGKLWRQVLGKTNRLDVGNRIGFIDFYLSKRYPDFTNYEKELEEWEAEMLKRGLVCDPGGRGEGFYFLARKMVKHVVVQIVEGKKAA